jgi:hypothetical protein
MLLSIRNNVRLIPNFVQSCYFIILKSGRRGNKFIHTLLFFKNTAGSLSFIKKNYNLRYIKLIRTAPGYRTQPRADKSSCQERLRVGRHRKGAPMITPMSEQTARTLRQGQQARRANTRLHSHRQHSKPTTEKKEKNRAYTGHSSRTF